MRYLIDPHNITDFNRDIADLEAFWLFCILVAGKNSRIQAQKLAEFLDQPGHWSTPFSLIRNMFSNNELSELVEDAKLGQYSRVIRAFTESLNLNLHTCTVNELESVYGVGPKTARLFLLHSRPNQRFAVIDTYLLKWLHNTLGVDVPKATPSNPDKYRELEQHYLNYCDQYNLSPAELDLHIWSKFNIERFGEV